jgi:two-component sensor histidine kinase
MGVGHGTATTLAMVVHELATNSVKHGALSADTGALEISSATDTTNLFLTWAESGGPLVDGAPEMSGFGSKMIARTMLQQFAGSLSYDWKKSGLVVTMQMNKERLAH